MTDHASFIRAAQQAQQFADRHAAQFDAARRVQERLEHHAAHLDAARRVQERLEHHAAQLRIGREVQERFEHHAAHLDAARRVQETAARHARERAALRARMVAIAAQVKPPSQLATATEAAAAFGPLAEAMSTILQATADAVRPLAAAMSTIQQAVTDAARPMVAAVQSSVRAFAAMLTQVTNLVADRASQTARSTRRLWRSITGKDEGASGAAWVHLREGVPLDLRPSGTERSALPSTDAPIHPILRHGPPRQAFPDAQGAAIAA